MSWVFLDAGLSSEGSTAYGSLPAQPCVCTKAEEEAKKRTEEEREGKKKQDMRVSPWCYGT
jgi:hypothetical protein